MDFTSDKLRSLVRKWQSLIEAHLDVKTTDGYLIRIFVIAFTKRRPNQVKKTTYAQSSQIRQIRKRMMEIMNKEASSGTLKDFVQKLIPEVIGREIEKACNSIYPLQNVNVLMGSVDFRFMFARSRFSSHLNLIFKNCWSCMGRIQRRLVQLFRGANSRSLKFKTVCRISASSSHNKTCLLYPMNAHFHYITPLNCPKPMSHCPLKRDFRHFALTICEYPLNWNLNIQLTPYKYEY
jgi:hypothetical protein